jgi:hypothetical protein
MKPQHPMVPVRWDNLNPKFGAAELTSTVELPPAPVTRTFEEFAKHRYLGVDNDRVNVFQQLNRLETPLFVMACAIDPIAPVANLKLFFDRLPSEDKRFLELSKASGCEKNHAHVDPPFAKNAAREVFEPVLEWISAHPARRTQKPAASTRIAEVEVIEDSAPRAAAQEARVYSEIAEHSDSERDGTLWGHALKNAAAVLSDLESDSPTEIDARPNRRSAAPRKRRTDSSPGKRSKKKVSTKAKKSASLTAAKTSKPADQSASQKKARKPVEKHSATDDRSAAGTSRARKTSTKAKARIRRSKDER